MKILSYCNSQRILATPNLPLNLNHNMMPNSNNSNIQSAIPGFGGQGYIQVSDNNFYKNPTEQHQFGQNSFQPQSGQNASNMMKQSQFPSYYLIREPSQMIQQRDITPQSFIQQREEMVDTSSLIQQQNQMKYSIPKSQIEAVDVNLSNKSDLRVQDISEKPKIQNPHTVFEEIKESMNAISENQEKYYKKLDFFYKRTCFRLMSEYFKQLFHPIQKPWADKRKKSSILPFLTTFAEKYFGDVILEMSTDFRQQFLGYLMGLVHSHRHNKNSQKRGGEHLDLLNIELSNSLNQNNENDEIQFGGFDIDYEIIRDTMYRYSKKAKDRFLKEPILAFLFLWFSSIDDAKSFISGKFSEKDEEYRERMNIELEDLRQQALKQLSQKGLEDSQKHQLLLNHIRLQQ
eukprot:403362339